MFSLWLSLTLNTDNLTGLGLQTKFSYFPLNEECTVQDKKMEIQGEKFENKIKRSKDRNIRAIREHKLSGNIVQYNI